MKISNLFTGNGPGIRMRCGYVRLPETVFDSHRYFTLIRHENGFLAACLYFELCARTADNFFLLGEVKVKEKWQDGDDPVETCTPWDLTRLQSVCPSYTEEELKTAVSVLMELGLVFWDGVFPGVLAIEGYNLADVCEYCG